jgi:hypothetical protein
LVESFDLSTDHGRTVFILVVAGLKFFDEDFFLVEDGADLLVFNFVLSDVGDDFFPFPLQFGEGLAEVVSVTGS